MPRHPFTADELIASVFASTSDDRHLRTDRGADPSFIIAANASLAIEAIARGSAEGERQQNLARALIEVGEAEPVRPQPHARSEVASQLRHRAGRGGADAAGVVDQVAALARAVMNRELKRVLRSFGAVLELDRLENIDTSFRPRARPSVADLWDASEALAGFESAPDRNGGTGRNPNNAWWRFAAADQMRSSDARRYWDDSEYQWRMRELLEHLGRHVVDAPASEGEDFALGYFVQRSLLTHGTMGVPDPTPGDLMQLKQWAVGMDLHADYEVTLISAVVAWRDGRPDEANRYVDQALRRRHEVVPAGAPTGFVSDHDALAEHRGVVRPMQSTLIGGAAFSGRIDIEFELLVRLGRRELADELLEEAAKDDLESRDLYHPALNDIEWMVSAGRADLALDRARTHIEIVERLGGGAPEDRASSIARWLDYGIMAATEVDDRVASATWRAQRARLAAGTRRLEH